MFHPDKNRYTDYECKIIKALKDMLPGKEAQSRMAPVGRETQTTNQKTQKAGVLLLLFPSDDFIHTVFIRRQVYDGVHSGQISLPGGKQESGDNNLTETALRETQEEIGIHKDDVKILGKLTPLYIPVSNNFVYPVIGSLPYEPELIPDTREVEMIYKVRLKELLDPTCIIENEIFIENNKEFRAPFFKIDELKIWGATAMILSEFIAIHENILTSSCR
jgi:8-oxo-dGTP pyrophosphatase MutT (NUDIX family)